MRTGRLALDGDNIQGSPLGKNFISQLATGDFFWLPEPFSGHQLATGIFCLVASAFFDSQEYFLTILVLQFLCQVAMFNHYHHHN